MGGVKTLSNGMFDELSDLRVLHLRNENTDDLEPGDFRGLERLEMFVLEGNGIATIGACISTATRSWRYLAAFSANFLILGCGIFTATQSKRSRVMHSMDWVDWKSSTFTPMRSMICQATCSPI